MAALKMVTVIKNNLLVFRHRSNETSEVGFPLNCDHWLYLYLSLRQK